MDETNTILVGAAKKLQIQGQLSEVAGYLVQVFGEVEAAKMLRAAARMIAPGKKAAK